MEIKEYIRFELAGTERSIKRVTDTITQQELSWRPASGSNSMGLILFHVAKFEDMMVHSRILGQPAIWKGDQWFSKIKMQESEDGAHYTVEQVNAFPVPEKDGLLAYFFAVRAQTSDCLDKLPLAEFERTVAMRQGEMKIGNIFSFVVTHAAGHIGEMSYLRGLQRGMDK